MNKSNCLFCQIVNGSLPSYKIYEDQLVYAFLDLYPTSDGHTLVIPKRHCEDWVSCDAQDLAAVAKATKIIAQKLQVALKPEGFNYVSNMGKTAYQVVMHFHIHIIPKYHRDFGYLLHRNTTRNSQVEAIHKVLVDHSKS